MNKQYRIFFKKRDMSDIVLELDTTLYQTLLILRTEKYILFKEVDTDKYYIIATDEIMMVKED